MSTGWRAKCENEDRVEAGRERKFSAVAIRVGFYVSVAYTGLIVFAWALVPTGAYLVTSALSVLGAAAAANWSGLRVFEGLSLGAVGLRLNACSARNFGIGLAGGALGALTVLGVPLSLGWAQLRASPEWGAGAASIGFVTALLTAGAAGEEMLFRGYGFQVLLRSLGPFATILPTGVIFGLAHGGNPGFGPLGLINTCLWGVLLGAAFLRSMDLWLPIGLHLGWNLGLAMFGANLSGFTIRLTGYELVWNIAAIWSGGDYGVEGGVLCTVVLPALGLYVWKAPVKRQSWSMALSRGGESC